MAPHPERSGAAHRIGVLLCDRANAFWTDMERAYAEMPSGEGVRVECVFPRCDGAPDRDAQSAAMREMLGRGYDALVVNPIDERNLAPAILEAAQTGATVFDVGPKCAPDAVRRAGGRYVPIPIADFAGQGRAAASAVLRRIGDRPGTVVLVAGRDDSVHSRKRVEGMRAVFAPLPSVRCVTLSAGFERGPAREICVRVLAGIPDAIAFCCANDEMALGVAEILARDGRKDDIVVAGIDGIPEAVEAIGRGIMDATVSLPSRVVALRVLGRVRSFLSGAAWTDEELLIGRVIPDEGEA